MNKVFLSGNLTRDVEVRYTQSGKAFARMGIAINRRYKDKESVDFFNLVAWEKTADFCGKYLAKGSRVLVEGQLKTNSYENKDGVKVNTVEIWVDNVEFAGAKRDNASGENYSGARSDYSSTSRNDYSTGYSANRDSAPPKRNTYDDGFGGEPIDPEDTPF
ncbi:MAG: single-stranded DNA-binding protein [Selenomonadaceae bacterium]|nr:single-stranded DNA-binding protein [Selenomonadaceae bacterium]